MRICPHCKSENPDNLKFCKNCLKVIQEKPKFTLKHFLFSLLLCIILFLVLRYFFLNNPIVDNQPYNYYATPAGSWANVSAQSSTDAILVYDGFTNSVHPRDIRLYVEQEGESIGYITIPSNNGSAPQNCTWTNAPSGMSAIYFDYIPAGELINSGDYYELRGLTPSTTYNVEIFHIPTDSSIPTTGAYPEFTTPP